MAAVSTPSMAAKPAAEPQSLDDLFLDAKPAAKKDPASLDDLFVKNVPPESEAEREPTSLDDLFLDREVAQPEPGTTQPAAPTKTVAGVDPAGAQKDDGQTRISGFFQNRLAYTYAKPRHWSKFENTLDVAATGRNGGVSWKLGGQLNYDPIYDLTDFYPSSVRDDQRLWGDIREAYLDFSVDAWEFRLGRQHIIWGEMVGLFFADVVSAKDLREAGLREFDMTRLPQWAARAEYFMGDFHGELVWIPHMTYNEIGKPGAEFYPFMPPPGITANILSEDQPKGLDDSAYGTRLSYLKDGWDMALFFYSSNDSSPAFERVSQVGSVVTFRPIHKRIQQWGFTTSKDLGSMVLKTEAVYTSGKQMYTADPADADGLVAQNALNYIVGLEWSFPQETRFNVQFYQQRIPGRKTDLLIDKVESGLSFNHVSKALHPRLETDVRLFSSLDHRDWLAQFKMNWRMDGNWRASFGVDVFSGDFLFGQYGDRDRVYTEVRYTF
jgi:hypothetical protein